MIVSTKYAMDKGMCLPEGVSKLLVLVQKYKMNEMCTVLDSGDMALKEMNAIQRIKIGNPNDSSHFWVKVSLDPLP
jgi:hypothetical protein